MFSLNSISSEILSNTNQLTRAFISLALIELSLRLQKLQKKNNFARKTRINELKDGWEDVNDIFQHQGLPYMPEIIRTEIISRHHDDLLVGHFGIDKTWKLVTKKY